MGIFAPALTPAQDIRAMYTGTDVNGRYWNTLSVQAKATYVIGAQDGMSGVLAHDAKNCSCTFEAVNAAVQATSGGGKNGTYVEFVEGVDLFYKDPANLGIPVIKALEYVTLKVKGATAGDLDSFIAPLRRNANR
jgi:hypothetical protein